MKDKSLGTLNYEAENKKLKMHIEKLNHELAYYRELLKENEAETLRLKSQMEIVYLIFGKGGY